MVAALRTGGCGGRNRLVQGTEGASPVPFNVSSLCDDQNGGRGVPPISCPTDAQKRKGLLTVGGNQVMDERESRGFRLMLFRAFTEPCCSHEREMP